MLLENAGNAMKRMGHLKQAFTLLEMVIVVALISVITAIAVSNIVGRMPTYRLEQASWRITSDLRAARMNAVSKSTDVVVTFDTSAKSYTIWTDADKDGAVDSGEQVTKSLSDIAGITLYTYPSTGTFKPQGTFSSTYYYWYISVNTSAGYRYVYVFPSGQVDPYGG